MPDEQWTLGTRIMQPHANFDGRVNSQVDTGDVNVGAVAHHHIRKKERNEQKEEVKAWAHLCGCC
jgi:hypothetical protein